MNAGPFDQAPVGLLATTLEGTIVEVNETFLRWTGYDRSDLVGRRTFAQLLTGGGRIYHETHYAPLLEMQGRVREIALDIVTADGRRLPALVNSVVDRDADGAPTLIRTAVLDATERREYERELLRAKQRAEESEAHARLLARTLQQTLIPPAPPEIPGLDVAAAYRPAGSGEEIGGDFYDVFQLAPDDWVIAVGDVRGKGVEAAVVTALTRYTIRAAAVAQPRLHLVLHTLNEVLLRHATERFCTVALLRLRRDDGRWRACVSCGGHALPLRTRPGSAPEPVGVPGALLGVFASSDFHDTEILLEPGDGLFLYTDGVTEGRRGGEWFGEERLVSALAAYDGSARSLVDGTLAEVLAFQGDDPRDDIVIVAVRVSEHADSGVTAG